MDTTRSVIDRDFLETVLLNYDSTLDTSEGSPIDTYVISPILDRLEEDPLQLDFKELAKSVLSTRFPDLDTSDGSALYDLVVKAMAALMDPIYSALQTLSNSLSLRNWEQLSSDEVDQLLANFFYSRPAQQYATGKVRIFYSVPVDVEVGEGVVFYTEDGLRYVPSLPQRITAAQMALNKVSDLYFFDVYAVAENVGDQYNVSSGTITRVTGLTQAVRATNPEAFSGGTASVDNFDAIEQARSLISQRTLVTYNGIISVIEELVSGLRAIQAVGYGDPEMQRDVITGGSAGAILAWGADAQFVDDRLGDGKTSVVYFPITDLGAREFNPEMILTITGKDHVVAAILDSHNLALEERVESEADRDVVVSGTDLQTFAGSPWVYSASTNFLGTSVVPGQALYIDDPTVGGWYKIVQVGYGSDSHRQNRLLLDRVVSASVSNLPFMVPFGHVWYLRKRVLEYVSESENVHSEYVGDRVVHIGGKADVYVAADLQDESVTLKSVSDTKPAVQGYSLRTLIVSGVPYMNRLQDPGVDFEKFGVKEGDTLHIYTGPAAGMYTVVGVDDNFKDALVIDTTLSSQIYGEAYRVSNDIDVELTNAKDVLYEGNDLITSAGLRSVTAGSGVDFQSLGVVNGDLLEITSGNDQGTYGIVGVSGAHHNVLVLDTGTSFSSSGIGYVVYRPLGQVQAPVVEVSKIEYTDSNGIVKGTLPRGEVIGSWVHGGMTNALHGDIPVQRGWTFDADIYSVVGIVSSDLTTVNLASLNGTNLSFDLDGTPVSVTFSSPSSPQDLVLQLDQVDELRGTSRIQQWHGGQYLVIGRTDDKVLRLVSGSAKSILGFYNQIISTSEVRSDVLSIRKATTFRAVDNPLSLKDLDLHLARVRINTDWGMKTVWLYEATDIQGSTLGGAVGFIPEGAVRHCPAGIFSASVGYASTGTVRLRFSDPTECVVWSPLPTTTLNPKRGWSREPTVLKDSLGNSYYPDPIFSSRVLPRELSAKLKNNGLFISSGSVSTSDSSYPDRDAKINFRSWGVKGGDLVVASTLPIEGSVDLSTFPAISGKSLRIVLGDHGSVTSIDFDSSVTTSSQLVDAINSQAGSTIARIYTNSGVEHLLLESDDRMVILSDGSATDAAPDILGPGYDMKTNRADLSLVISKVSDDGQVLLVEDYSPVSTRGAHFSVVRPASQGITPLQMQEDEYGFYYFDIEVVSDGFGDSWNLDDGAEMKISNYSALGWRLYSAYPELTFSDQEKLWAVITTKVVEEGAESEPDNWVQTLGMDLTVYYTTSRAVSQVQGILDDPSYRVVTADLLAKHLRPVRVYIDLTYSGGDNAVKLESEVTDLIESTSPGKSLSIQSVSELLHRLGASTVSHPIDLVAAVTNDDRSMNLIHSSDRLDVGQRSILYAGQVVVARK